MSQRKVKADIDTWLVSASQSPILQRAGIRVVAVLPRSMIFSYRRNIVSHLHSVALPFQLVNPLFAWSWAIPLSLSPWNVPSSSYHPKLPNCEACWTTWRSMARTIRSVTSNSPFGLIWLPPPLTMPPPLLSAEAGIWKKEIATMMVYLLQPLCCDSRWNTEIRTLVLLVFIPWLDNTHSWGADSI